jgi:hypothetical protein
MRRRIREPGAAHFQRPKKKEENIEMQSKANFFVEPSRNVRRFRVDRF